MRRGEGRNPSPSLKSNSLTAETVKLSWHKAIFHTMRFLDSVLCQPLSFLHHQFAASFSIRCIECGILFTLSVKMLKHCHYQRVLLAAIGHELPPIQHP